MSYNRRGRDSSPYRHADPYHDTYHRDFARTSARDREYDRARRVERPARFNRGGYDDGDDDYRHSRDYDIDDTGLTRPAHRSSSRGDRYSEYRGKDHEKYAPYSYKGPLNLGGPPNREIMMTDLAPYMNEDDISAELVKHYHLENLEDVRVIRDQRTGTSRKFGFIRFSSTEEAKDFMESNVEHNHPLIYLYGRIDGDLASQATQIHIQYSRERKSKDKAEESMWQCGHCFVTNYPRRFQCFKCGASKTHSMTGGMTAPKPAHFKNTGAKDISPDPSHFLIFKNLDPNVTEDKLAKGGMKLFKADDVLNNTIGKVASTAATVHAGAQPGSLRRVFLIRDKQTKGSWCFGFAEFINVQEAQAAFAKYKGLDKFTISSKPVELDNIHSGVFKPSLDGVHQANQAHTFAASTNPSLRLAYWDEEGYASELQILDPSTADAMKISQTASNEEEAKYVKNGGKEADTKPKRRKVEPGSKEPAKKPPLDPDLQRWTNRHAELHNILKETETKEKPTMSDNQASSAIDKASADMEKRNESAPFINAEAPHFACFLCYVSSETYSPPTNAAALKNHVLKSDSHAAKLANKPLCDSILAKLAATSVAAKGPLPDFISPPHPAQSKAALAQNKDDILRHVRCYLCMLRFKTPGHAHLHARLDQGHIRNLQDAALVAETKQLLALRAFDPIDDIRMLCYLCNVAFTAPSLPRACLGHARHQQHKDNLERDPARAARISKRETHATTYIIPAANRCFLCPEEPFKLNGEVVAHVFASVAHKAAQDDPARVEVALAAKAAFEAGGKVG